MMKRIQIHTNFPSFMFYSPAQRSSLSISKEEKKASLGAMCLRPFQRAMRSSKEELLLPHHRRANFLHHRRTMREQLWS